MRTCNKEKKEKLTLESTNRRETMAYGHDGAVRLDSEAGRDGTDRFRTKAGPVQVMISKPVIERFGANTLFVVVPRPENRREGVRRWRKSKGTEEDARTRVHGRCSQRCRYT